MKKQSSEELKAPNFPFTLMRPSNLPCGTEAFHVRLFAGKSYTKFLIQAHFSLPATSVQRHLADLDIEKMRRRWLLWCFTCGARGDEDESHVARRNKKKCWLLRLFAGKGKNQSHPQEIPNPRIQNYGSQGETAHWNATRTRPTSTQQTRCEASQQYLRREPETQRPRPQYSLKHRLNGLAKALNSMKVSANHVLFELEQQTEVKDGGINGIGSNRKVEIPVGETKDRHVLNLLK
ncbi:unnamed protein product [Darwinula stevensoni]|uniref:Uncharacterized protein n=1 Tax=Darwinula stevensoni TaxID=69355 RepID=A0A7R8WYM6_9CRUS|nr:unnamed protein product [Darwinula stevensoni]CAG0879111.1 unnamed protein product [Darwinula stevensoni]